MERPAYWRARLQSACVLAALASAWTGAFAAAAGTGEVAALQDDLTLLSLEDLMRIEITSASKRAEPLSDASAAISVLTGDEIRRSGARNLAEALRLIPGVEVAASSAQSYAITVRGFNSTSSDKLEVLLDGRSVYTPLFSGVFWDSLYTFLPDIDRIEVIRGPGAALWGANAVNGVINIVTRPAGETVGTLVGVAAGTQERGYVGVRSGSRIGESAALRLYGIGREIDRSERADGSEAEDGMRFRQFGFRADGDRDDGGLTLSGDFYDGTIRATSVVGGEPVDYEVTGANLVARWVREDFAGGRLAVQAYYDHSDRRQPTSFAETRDTADLSVQHDRRWGERHTFVYGAGVRSSRDQTGAPPGYAIVWDPAERQLDTYSAFVQDQIALGGGSGTLTLGSKFEHNDFTGFEFQPNARLGWRWSPRWFTWGSVSRAVRTPNRLDSDIAIFCPPPDGFPGVCEPGLFRIGNPDLDSEKVLAFDAGLRLTASERLSFDLALFHNRYTDLRSTEADVGFFGGFANQLEADSFGAELIASWQLRDDLTLRSSYAFLQVDAEANAGSTDTSSAARWEGSDPHHRASLRASWQPAADWTVDGFLRYVGRLDFYDVPAYAELNLRVGWRPRPDLEFALIGDNLLDDRHAEFNANPDDPAAPRRSEVERAARATVTWEWR